MRLAREFVFFAYLLESYAAHKGTDAGSVLRLLDQKGLTDYVYDMYELYPPRASTTPSPTSTA